MEKGRILVVEDSKVSLKYLVAILDSVYEVHTAASGLEGIQQAQAVQPDLILMDIVMPVMDGFEALKILKESESLKHIPVIIITGMSDDENEEKGLSLGAVDYIHKPYKTTIVLLRVGIHMEIVRQRKQIERLTMTNFQLNIPNRRFFEHRLQEEWVRAKRDKRPLSVLLVGVDKMREYNISYGHTQGDRALLRIATILQGATEKRTGDIAARWAGDTFAILLLDTMVAEANTVAERLRAEVESTVIEKDDGEPTGMTVSIGVNSASPADGTSIETFLSDGDAALYTAVQLGRNQVAVHS